MVEQQIDEEQDETVVVEQQIDEEQDETVVVEQREIDEEQDEPTKTQSISLQNCILKLNITFYKV